MSELERRKANIPTFSKCIILYIEDSMMVITLAITFGATHPRVSETYELALLNGIQLSFQPFAHERKR